VADKTKKPVLEIAISGAGVGPETVPPRQIVELVEAVIAFHEALFGRPHGNDVPFALVGISHGSVRLRFQPRTEPATQIARMKRVIKVRGEGESPHVRYAIRRMRKAARSGALEIRPPRGKPLLVAAPVDDEPYTRAYTTTLHGQIVGLSRKGKGAGFELVLQPRSGPRVDLALPADLVTQANKLFDKAVRISAMVDIDEDDDGQARTTRRVLAVDAFEPADLVDLLIAARQELERDGFEADPMQLIAELD
jgi:hypothetical protein